MRTALYKCRRCGFDYAAPAPGCPRCRAGQGPPTGSGQPSSARVRSARARLIVVRGNLPRPEFSLDGTSLSIGRASGNSLLLPENDLAASRHHARVDPDGTQYVITDVGSTNGTYVNGRRIQCEVLANGTRIQLGNAELEFRLDGAPVAGIHPPQEAGAEPASAAPWRISDWPYEIEATIGEGGMATIYRAHCTLPMRDGRKPGHVVALKVPLPQFASDPEFVERFRRETGAGKELNHPNVVRVYQDSGTYARPVIVMELAPRGSLRGLIRPGGMDVPSVCSVVQQCCAGLGHAHSRGIVHRDIKPENVLIGSDNRMKIADFGIAHYVSRRTVVVGRMLGAPFYMSPEQVEGREVDARSDIYSLCVVIYEMCTGTLPFVGDDCHAVMNQHVHTAPQPPSYHNPRLPASMNQTIMRGLSKQRTARFATTAELARCFNG